jgi:hypothetical protein
VVCVSYPRKRQLRRSKKAATKAAPLKTHPTDKIDVPTDKTPPKWHSNGQKAPAFCSLSEVDKIGPEDWVTVDKMDRNFRSDKERC